MDDQEILEGIRASCLTIIKEVIDSDILINEFKSFRISLQIYIASAILWQYKHLYAADFPKFFSFTCGFDSQKAMKETKENITEGIHFLQKISPLNKPKDFESMNFH